MCRPLPLNESFPSPQQLSAFKGFSLEYGAVDRDGLREADQATGGSNHGEECATPAVLDSFKRQLAMVRGAVKGEAGAGATVEVYLDNYQQGGCDFLQLIGALAFQVAAGNIDKISCVWASDPQPSFAGGEAVVRVDQVKFMAEVLKDALYCPEVDPELNLKAGILLATTGDARALTVLQSARTAASGGTKGEKLAYADALARCRDVAGATAAFAEYWRA